MTITVTLAIVAWTLLALSTLANPNVFDPIVQPQTAAGSDPSTPAVPAAGLHVVTSLPAGQTHPTPVVDHARIIYLNYDGSDDPAAGAPSDDDRQWLDHDDSTGVQVDPGWVTHGHHDPSDAGT